MKGNIFMKKDRKMVALLLAATVLSMQICEPVYAEELNAGQEYMSLETEQEINGVETDAEEDKYTDGMPANEAESENQDEMVPESENEDVSEDHDLEAFVESDSNEEDDTDAIGEERAQSAWEIQMRRQAFLDHGPDYLDAGNDISVASNEIDVFSSRSSDLENINNILVLVRFQGQDEYMNGENSIRLNRTYNTMEGSMQEYISEMSYGELNVSTQFFPQSSSATYYSIEVDQPIEYYLAATAENTEGYFTFSERMEREKALCDEVLRKLKIENRSELQQYDFDSNADGYMDSISFAFDTASAIYPINHNDLLWPHKTSYVSSETINGISMYSYNFLSRGTDSWGIMGSEFSSSATAIHEFMHTLGLPDLYRYTRTGTPVGCWDVMANTASVKPQNLSAYYQREYMEWGEPLDTITKSTHVTLSAAQYDDPSEKYAVKIVSSSNPNEIFVVEFRNLSGNDQVLSSYCTGGLLVYRMVNDVKLGVFASSGNAGDYDAMYVFRPGETGLNAGKGNIYDAALSAHKSSWNSIGIEKGKEGIDEGTALTYYDGSNSGICIKNVTLGSADTISFDVEFTEETIEKQPEFDVTVNSSGTGFTGILKNYKAQINENVSVGVWSKENGQDDLKWYEANLQQDGIWKIEVDISDHENNSGIYYFHVYVGNGTKKRFLAGTIASIETTVQPVLDVQLNAEESAGNLTLKYLKQESDADVRFAVWSQTGGQDDLKWYHAEKQSGKWAASFQIKNHKNDTGIYYIHAYQYIGGSARFLAGAAMNIEGIKAETVHLQSGDAYTGKILLKAGQVKSPASVQTVKVAVWTTANGQDDLRWYEMQKNGDDWQGQVNLSDHFYEWGTYNFHFYAKDERGVEKCIGTLSKDITTQKTKLKIQLNDSESRADICLEGGMPAGVKKIKYAVWSAINGQDDLQWYTPENLAYLSSADISNHNNDTGAYYVHTYVTMENGTSRFLTGGSFAVTGISCDSVNIENKNEQDGTFEVKIKNVKSPANIERVRVAVWTKRNGQDDILWYFPIVDENGNWNAHIDTYMHDYESGVYYVHVYARDARGMETYIGGCAFDFRQDTSMVTLTMQNIPEENLFDISFVSKKIGKNVRKIKFAVWSKVDGQDDLKWYEAVKNTSENKWSARVYTTDHKNNSGVYYVHAYGVLENGGTVCLKTAETTILTDYMPSVKTQAIQVGGLKKTYRFLFVSDTHVIVPDAQDELRVQELGSSRMNYFRNRKWMTSEEQFPYWMEYANKNHVDGLLMGGDIIDYPSFANIRYMKNNLDTLQMPYLYVFGNHDWTYPWEYMTHTASKLYKPLLKQFIKGNDAAQILEYEDLVILGIDDSTNRVDEEALPIVQQALELGKPVIVMLHVPLQTDTLMEKSIKGWGTALMIGEDAIKPDEATQKFLDMILNENSPVCAVLAGHVHLEDTSPLNDRITQYVVEMSSKGNGILVEVKGK